MAKKKPTSKKATRKKTRSTQRKKAAASTTKPDQASGAASKQKETDKKTQTKPAKKPARANKEDDKQLAAENAETQEAPPAKAQPQSTDDASDETHAERSKHDKPPSGAKAQKRKAEDKPIFVVALGASAGGLEAFTEILNNLRPNTGMAFLFVQHLDPRHKSNLSEILGRVTDMPVAEATNGVRLKPNHAYVMPPANDLEIFDGVIKLVARPQRSELHMPIDQCFRSLAEAQGEFAVGVVLSGTGSDGAVGLGAIKACGGYALVQDPATAKYDGMPSHAIKSGHADLVLSPKDIAEELIRIDNHISTTLADKTPDEAIGFDGRPLHRIFQTLRRFTGVDFSQYKESTLERRIARRMVVHQIDEINRYADYLHQNNDEVQALFSDMLIGVTAFFREPKTFEALKETAFPDIVADRDADDPIRIWVPGCATGEEVYSIIICLLEYLDDQDRQHPIQVFATDINEVAIETARAAIYPPTVAADISRERLRRHFRKVDSGYQINKSIRDLCVFAKQDITRDPPFSKVDLISCRNVLIYLKPETQKRVIPVFHYALRPEGCLQLGGSESIGSFSHLFQAADVKHKIYKRKMGSVRLPADFGYAPAAHRIADEAPEPSAPQKRFDLHHEADRAVLNRYAPPGVVVDEEMEVLQFRGRTSRYLEHPPGRPSLRLYDLCRPGMVARLRKAIALAKEQQAPSREEGVLIEHNGDTINVTLVVHPIKAPDTGDRYYMVLFEEETSDPAKPAPEKGHADEAPPSSDEARGLREELNEVSESLQRTLEEHHVAVEELRAANEEIQSSNEELQTTNEELETAKEELQSSNEELTTLNEELESRNTELSRMADDQRNLIDSVNIPVVMVGSNLCIRTFTAPAEDVLGLRMGDIGRPIRELKLGLDIDDLEDCIRRVIEQLDTYEKDVGSLDGGTVHSLRIRPYKTADNKIDGAVLVLVDITEPQQARGRAESAHTLVRGVIDTIHEPLVVLDSELKVIFAGRSFYQAFDVRPDQTEGKRLYELGNGQWEIPALRELLEKILPEQTTVEDFRVKHDFPSIGRRTMLLNAKQVQADGNSPYILLTMRDVTGDNEES